MNRRIEEKTGVANKEYNSIDIINSFLSGTKREIKRLLAKPTDATNDFEKIDLNKIEKEKKDKKDKKEVKKEEKKKKYSNVAVETITNIELDYHNKKNLQPKTKNKPEIVNLK